MVLGQVVGGRQPVAAGADDDYLVMRLRIGAAPGALPVLVITERLFRNGKGGIAFHLYSLGLSPVASALAGASRDLDTGLDHTPQRCQGKSVT